MTDQKSVVLPLAHALKSTVLSAILSDTDCHDSSQQDMAIPVDVSYDALVVIRDCLNYESLSQDSPPAPRCSQSVDASNASAFNPSASGPSQGVFSRAKRIGLSSSPIRKHLTQLPLPLFYQVIKAVNYLNFEDLYYTCCVILSNKMKNKSVEEMRAIFSIQNDLTPDEQRDLQNKYAWIL